MKCLRNIHSCRICKKSGKGRNWTDSENELFWKRRITVTLHKEQGTADNVGNATVSMTTSLQMSRSRIAVMLPSPWTMYCHVTLIQTTMRNMSYGIAKKENQLRHLTKTIDLAKNQLHDIMKRKGYCHVKNIHHIERASQQWSPQVCV